MELRHTIEAPARRASFPAVPAIPRLSRRAGLWAVAFSFLVVAAFSTAPSPLYGLFAHREHLSSLTITFAYAVYAVGVVVSLVLVGHVSDWYGRRAVLLPAIAVAAAAAVLFLVWRSLAGLLAARVLTGVALGATVATATAHIADLAGAATRRAGIVATVANIGGLACGPLIAGLLASNEANGLTLPFQVFLAALVLAGLAVLLAPEGHPPLDPRPRYRPQRLSVPPQARRQFTAAAAGVGLCFAVLGLYAGLSGMLLAGPLHHPSPALVGVTIFLSFGAGAVAQTMTTGWAPQRLIAAGIAAALIGLGVLVASAWTSPPSLVLFEIAGIVAGAGSGAIFRGSLTTVILTTGAEDRAGVLATFFTAGYAGLSVPVIGVGLLFQHLSPRVTLLIFALVVGLGILAAAPVLVRPADADPA